MRLRVPHGLRALLAFLAFAVCLAVGAGLVITGPSYSASARVVVTPLTFDVAPVGMPVFRDFGEPVRTIETAAALLDTRAAAQLTADRLGTGWTADAVERAMTIRPQGQTNLVELQAQARTPRLAAAVANTYMAAALDLRSRELERASSAALRDMQDQLAALTRGGAEEAARARSASLLLLQTYGDPSAEPAQEAAPPTRATGLPPYLLLGVSVLAGVFAAAAVLALTQEEPAAPAEDREGPAVPPGHLPATGPATGPAAGTGPRRAPRGRTRITLNAGDGDPRDRTRDEYPVGRGPAVAARPTEGAPD